MFPPCTAVRIAIRSPMEPKSTSTCRMRSRGQATEKMGEGKIEIGENRSRLKGACRKGGGEGIEAQRGAPHLESGIARKLLGGVLVAWGDVSEAVSVRRVHARGSHRRPHTFNDEEIQHEPVQVLL